MFIFKYLLFGHFELEANEIWYQGKPVNALCTCDTTKWLKGKVSIYSVLQVRFSQIGPHINTCTYNNISRVGYSFAISLKDEWQCCIQ